MAAKKVNKDLPTKEGMDYIKKNLKTKPGMKVTDIGKSNLDKTVGSRSKSGASTVAAVAKRFGITAREARDIATAVGSAATAIRKSPQEGMPVKKIVKNVAKQVKETATAAKTGKKGTSAYVVSPNKASQSARKAAGDKGFVTYNVKGSKKR
jgi:hypothetical protein